RHRIAALDMTTGTATQFDPDAEAGISYPEPEIKALAVRGQTVFAAGIFDRIGGLNVTHLAALDAISGKALDWNGGADGIVWALAAGENEVYVGGDFLRTGTIAAENISAISMDAPGPDGGRGPISRLITLAQNAPNPVQTTARIDYTLGAPS